MHGSYPIRCCGPCVVRWRVHPRRGHMTVSCLCAPSTTHVHACSKGYTLDAALSVRAADGTLTSLSADDPTERAAAPRLRPMPLLTTMPHSFPAAPRLPPPKPLSSRPRPSGSRRQQRPRLRAPKACRNSRPTASSCLDAPLPRALWFRCGLQAVDFCFFIGTCAQLVYNGFRTCVFDVLSSVVQGSPLSPLVYDLCCQPLASYLLHLQRTGAIRADALPGGTPAPPSHQHADDTCLYGLLAHRAAFTTQTASAPPIEFCPGVQADVHEFARAHVCMHVLNFCVRLQTCKRMCMSSRPRTCVRVCACPRALL